MENGMILLYKNIHKFTREARIENQNISVHLYGKKRLYTNLTQKRLHKFYQVLHTTTLTY